MFTIMQISRQKVQDAFNRILCSRFAQKTTMAFIDQDVKKTIMLTIGGCIAFIALSEALPLFFK